MRKPEQTTDEEKARHREALELRAAGHIPEKLDTLWWLSFATKEGFLGAVIVRGADVESARASARAIDCDPGGDCHGVPAHPDDVPSIPPQSIGRLMDAEECRALDALLMGEN